MLDFVHVMVDMVRFNTPFLNLFWYNSPVPDVDKSLFSGANLMFIIIYILIFVGLALQASGARMSRQVKFIREGLEDQMILEQAKGSEGHAPAAGGAHHAAAPHHLPAVLPAVYPADRDCGDRLVRDPPVGAAGRRGLNHERGAERRPERYDASGCNSASTARCAATRCWPPNRLLRLSR